MAETVSQLAFVFPGQGSQYVGMGRDLAAMHPASAQVFKRAEDATGLPLSDLCFNGPEEALKDTVNAQPAIVTASIASLEAYRVAGGPEAGRLAGHSLGEYSALIAAHAIDLASGVSLVRRRGELMSEAARQRVGTMAAVLGLDNAMLENLCENDAGVVVMANLNSPGQAVISGETDAVERVGAKAKEAGAKRVIPLPVSGAFHSPLMESAADGMIEALHAIGFRVPEAPVYANVTARRVENPEALKRLLPEQIVSGVRWEETVRTMVEDGVTVFVEMGPGKVLSGLIRKIDSSVTVFNVEDNASLEKTLNGLTQILEG